MEQVVGAIGSQVGNAATEIVKVVKKPVLKALTASGLNFAKGMMLDSGAQLATEGEIDTERDLYAGLTDAVTSVGIDFISGEFRTKVPDKRIVDTIETPYGKAQQDYSMEALELRNKAKNGEVELYRGGVLGVSETTEAQFWAPEPPFNSGYANKYGVANDNFDYYVKGHLKPDTDFITRQAPGLGKNSGGALEIVTKPGKVILDYFIMKW